MDDKRVKISLMTTRCQQSNRAAASRDPIVFKFGAVEFITAALTQDILADVCEMLAVFRTSK